MAENTNRSGGGNAALGFILGGVVVVLAIVAYFVFARAPSETRKVDIDVNVPEMQTPTLPPVEPPTVPTPTPPVT